MRKERERGERVGSGTKTKRDSMNWKLQGHVTKFVGD